jgi:hypothetical protein
MFYFKKIITAAVLATVAFPSSAGIVNCPFDKKVCKTAWDFERGKMPPSNAFDNRFLKDGRFQIVKGDAFAGNKYGRVIVRANDDAMIGRDNKKNERAEIRTKDMRKLEGEIHFGVAVRFGADFKAHNERTLIVQIKSQLEESLKASPQFAIYHHRADDRWKVCNNFKNLNGCDYRKGRIFKSGVWHRILVSQNATSGPEGWLKMYIDGKLIYSHKGPTKYSAKEKFSTFRTGIYRDHVAHTQVLDVDNFIVSTDLNAVATFLKLDASKLK